MHQIADVLKVVKLENGEFAWVNKHGNLVTPDPNSEYYTLIDSKCNNVDIHYYLKPNAEDSANFFKSCKQDCQIYCIGTLPKNPTTNHHLYFD